MEKILSFQLVTLAMDSFPSLSPTARYLLSLDWQTVQASSVAWTTEEPEFDPLSPFWISQTLLSLLLPMSLMFDDSREKSTSQKSFLWSVAMAELPLKANQASRLVLWERPTPSALFNLQEMRLLKPALTFHEEAPEQVMNMNFPVEQATSELEFQLKSSSMMDDPRGSLMVLKTAQLEVFRMMTSPFCMPMPTLLPSLENLADLGWLGVEQEVIRAFVSILQKLTRELVESTERKVALSKEKSISEGEENCAICVSQHQLRAGTSRRERKIREIRVGRLRLFIPIKITKLLPLLSQETIPHNIFLLMLNSTPRHFTLETRGVEVLVAEANGAVRILLTHSDSLSLSHQLYSDANISAVGGVNFKRPAELFQYLEGVRNMGDRWMVSDLANLQVARGQGELVRLALKIVSDPVQLSKLLLFKLGKAREERGASQSPLELGEMKQDIAGLKSSHSSIGGKLKGIGQLFETLRAEQQRTVEAIAIQSKARQVLEHNLKQADHRMGQFQQSLNQSMKKFDFQLDILEKTMHRNQTTLRTDFETACAELGKKIKVIREQIEEYNFPKMREDMDGIARLFELEIKVKDHEFTPETGLQKGSMSKKLHWLNSKILKNLQDVKDYNKVAGKALPIGISKLRFQVNVIKNNGLMLGICNSKGREHLQSCAFNDESFITLNSCGYVTNRGAMHMSNAKIKSGDTVKMVVNISQGVIHWFCNDVEVAVADMGPMSKQKVFPMVGLGYFGDEVEILQAEQPKQPTEMHQSYTHELQRLNQKFGRTRSYRE